MASVSEMYDVSWEGKIKYKIDSPQESLRLIYVSGIRWFISVFYCAHIVSMRDCRPCLTS